MSACRHCGREGRFYRSEPHGYVSWFEWAEQMGKTHHQEPCPGCDRLSVWRLGPSSALVAYAKGALRVAAGGKAGGMSPSSPV
jgi:hypothetical protein